MGCVIAAANKKQLGIQFRIDDGLKEGAISNNFGSLITWFWQGHTDALEISVRFIMVSEEFDGPICPIKIAR